MTLFVNPTKVDTKLFENIAPEIKFERRLYLFPNDWGASVWRMTVGKKDYTNSEGKQNWELRVIKVDDEGYIYFPKHNPLINRMKWGWLSSYGVEHILKVLKAFPDPYEEKPDFYEQDSLDHSKYMEEHGDEMDDDSSEEIARETRIAREHEQRDYEHITGDHS